MAIRKKICKFAPNCTQKTNPKITLTKLFTNNEGNLIQHLLRNFIHNLNWKIN
jgi:hypothetical protein